MLRNGYEIKWRKSNRTHEMDHYGIKMDAHFVQTTDYTQFTKYIDELNCVSIYSTLDIFFGAWKLDRSISELLYGTHGLHWSWMRLCFVAISINWDSYGIFARISYGNVWLEIWRECSILCTHFLCNIFYSKIMQFRYECKSFWSRTFSE